MTRLIERWFPCAEVSEHSARGWGSGQAEKALFTWFASRPLAQAKAAVICSLLPWPDDESEQERLKGLVRESMTGYDAANAELRTELAKHYPDGAKLLDSFSGRAMIPLEAARLGVQAWGIDYSPVATLAGKLLADYPMRNWDDEPPLPFDGYADHTQRYFSEPRLLRDVRFVLDLVGDRYEAAMDEFYPMVDGKRPWGYLWAITIPCVGCGNRFPLTVSLTLRKANPKKDDLGQSYCIVANRETGELTTAVHDGLPTQQSTLIKVPRRSGKTAVCCFCELPHPLDTQKRLMRDGLAEDRMLVVADLDRVVGKNYRIPTAVDAQGLAGLDATLNSELSFAVEIPAVPAEVLTADLTALVRPAGYGYRSYGELCNNRQTLGLVRLARIIDMLAQSLKSCGASNDYTATLAGYAAANLVRRLTRSTRGVSLEHAWQKVSHAYANEGSLGFRQDYFETGCADGPGTWRSLTVHTIRSLSKQFDRVQGQPAFITRGSALSVPLPDGSIDAVVTDPPYAAMINYCDSSDLFFVWLKRALVTSHSWFGITSDPAGLQEKAEEAVVKFGNKEGDHRTEEHYRNCIAKAFEQARRKITPEGVVTIIFGHGDPDVWHDLLSTIDNAGLVLTGSWPARTERAAGPGTGDSNIETTLTLACRPAPPDRPIGRVVDVDAEVRQAVFERVPLWKDDKLAISDQLMASAGPAMEVVGRYGEVRDHGDEKVDLDRYLPLARRFVQEAAAIQIDGRPLGDFDKRSQFALFWARQYRRSLAAASEARWQRLASDMTEEETAGLLTKSGKGMRLAYASESVPDRPESDPPQPASGAVIDVALAVAAAGRSLGTAEVLAHQGRSDDELLWAAMAELARLLGESDADGGVWTWVVRHRDSIAGRADDVEIALDRQAAERERQDRQGQLFDGSLEEKDDEEEADLAEAPRDTVLGSVEAQDDEEETELAEAPRGTVLSSVEEQDDEER